MIDISFSEIVKGIWANAIKPIWYVWAIALGAVIIRKVLLGYLPRWLKKKTQKRKKKK